MTDSPEYWLERNFVEVLELPPAAVTWLLDLWHVSQTFDDLADGDPVDRATLDETIWRTLVGLPGNAFFQANCMSLLPALATAILKWKGSDTAEREGHVDARTFVWRAAYYDIVLLTVSLCRGPKIALEMADEVMKLYGEKFEDYLKEFSYA